MTTQINLLPARVQTKKKQRRTILTLAGLQVVFCLLIYASNQMLGYWEERTRAYAMELSAYVNRIDPAWMTADTDARALLAMQVHNIDSFDGYWLISIIEAVPTGTTLVRMNYRNEQIIITAATQNIALSELHRRSVAITELFYSVRLGRVVYMGNGRYNYEIIIQI